MIERDENGVAKEFASIKLNAEGQARVNHVRLAFSNLLEVVDREVHLLHAGRERALVITKLEEAGFFAVRGVCKDPRNQAE